MKIAELRHLIDRDHENRAQHSNPAGTPNRHRIRKLRFKFHKSSRSRHDLEGATMVAKSVEGKKKVEEKAKETKPAKPETWGSKEMAAKLGIDGKRLRTVLRAAGKGVAAEGETGRYSWKPNDEKAIASVKKLVDDYEAKAKARAEKKAAEEKKASAKKSNGKTAKKSKKAAEPEEDEEVFEEEEEATE